jgi:hypothetical protein
MALCAYIAEVLFGVAESCVALPLSRSSKTNARGRGSPARAGPCLADGPQLSAVGILAPVVVGFTAVDARRQCESHERAFSLSHALHIPLTVLVIGCSRSSNRH